MVFSTWNLYRIVDTKVHYKIANVDSTPKKWEGPKMHHFPQLNCCDFGEESPRGIPKAASCPYCKSEYIDCSFHESEINNFWCQKLLTRFFLSVSHFKTALNTMRDIIAYYCWRCECFPTKHTSRNAAFRAYWVWTTSCLIIELILIACLPNAILTLLLNNKFC